MTFKADLLPSTNLGYDIGSTDTQWNFFGALNGTATYAISANYALNATSSTYSLNAASANYANSSNCASHAIHSGSATYATKANQDSSGNTITSSYLSRQAWWKENESHSVNDLRGGCTFVYTTHSAPVTGTLVSFDCSTNTNYTLQLMGKYNGTELYYRTRNGDNGTWNSWLRLVHNSGTWGISITGNAATATNSDTVDGYHASSFAKIANHNDLIASGNEFTCAKNSMSGAIWFNYRTAGGLNGNIDQYNFGNGKGGALASITANHFNGGADFLTLTYCRGDSSASNAGVWRSIKNGKSNAQTNKVNFYTVYSDGGPESYGEVLEILSINANHWQPQVFLGAGTGGHTWYRNKGYNDDTWGPFRKLWQQGDSVTGAVWNDYAEYRESHTLLPGYVVQEVGDDTLQLTTQRLDHFAGVTSDTWGFAQGETEKAKTPIAVAGRVLVYPGEDRNSYKPGDCVCAGPNGKVYIMTREEVCDWPDRIVGTVSCVPEYDMWGGGEGADRDPVKVNGRIWIKVK